jgi:hypothetical protein
VQPPPRKRIINPIPQNLMVSFHFTHRAGVAVQVFDAGNGTVGIMIVLGDMNPAPVPRNQGQNVEWSQLQTEEEALYVGLEVADILTLKIASAFILALGIETDLYEAPSASSPLDNQNVATPVAIDSLASGAGFSQDDNQPFPIYGWLNVWWQDEQVVVKPTTPAAG